MFGLSTTDRQRLERMEESLKSLASHLDRVDAALVVRDPGNARSVEAYDGLRRQVAAAAGDRRRLCLHLVVLRERLNDGAAPGDLGALLDEWIAQAGIDTVQDPLDPECFDIVPGLGDSLRVVRPAWKDSHTGVVIKRGIAERYEAPEGRARSGALDERTADPSSTATRAGRSNETPTDTEQATSSYESATDPRTPEDLT